MIQPWFCEDCGVEGAVEYENERGTWGVIAAIADQHYQRREGFCSGVHIRVVNMEKLKEETNG